jgi:putative transposase
MGSVGDCYDNAMAESFFAILECELLARQAFRTQLEARSALFESIEVFYNRQRRHSATSRPRPLKAEQGVEQRLLPNEFLSIKPE